MTPTPAKRPCVLLVDDTPANIQILVGLLQNDYDLKVATRGAQALKICEQTPHIDLILLDVMMPEMDGYEVCRKLRAAEAMRGIPIIFLTAKSEAEDVVRGFETGASDYVAKPFRPAELLARVRTHLLVRAQQREIAEQHAALMEHHQREISAHWSHELLTPLTAVIGSLDLLELDADSISRTELRELLALIRQGANRQERLSRKLIRYFSLEQAAQTPSNTLRRCSVEAAIRAATTQAAQLKKRETDVTLALETGHVALTEDQLKHAVSEIVENAATFSPPGSPISVTGARRDGRYRITITDQGPGLAAEQRAKIGAFTQFDRKTLEQQGLGLGLAIARLTAKLAKGSLTLAPATEGKGLSVEFDLPEVE